MNNPRDNESLRARERRMLPFAVEFVKFCMAFVIIIAIALLTLRFAAASM